MAKKNFTWTLDEDLVYKVQKLAEKEHRSLTNYIEVMFIEKSQSVSVGGKKIKKKMRHNDGCLCQAGMNTRSYGAQSCPPACIKI